MYTTLVSFLIAPDIAYDDFAKPLNQSADV